MVTWPGGIDYYLTALPPSGNCSFLGIPHMCSCTFCWGLLGSPICSAGAIDSPPCVGLLSQGLLLHRRHWSFTTGPLGLLFLLSPYESLQFLSSGCCCCFSPTISALHPQNCREVLGWGWGELTLSFRHSLWKGPQSSAWRNLFLPKALSPSEGHIPYFTHDDYRVQIA